MLDVKVLVCYKFSVDANEMAGMGIFCRYGQNPKLWTTEMNHLLSHILYL